MNRRSGSKTGEERQQEVKALKLKALQEAKVVAEEDAGRFGQQHGRDTGCRDHRQPRMGPVAPGRQDQPCRQSEGEGPVVLPGKNQQPPGTGDGIGGGVGFQGAGAVAVSTQSDACGRRWQDGDQPGDAEAGKRNDPLTKGGTSKKPGEPDEGQGDGEQLENIASEDAIEAAGEQREGAGGAKPAAGGPGHALHEGEKDQGQGGQ